MDKEILRRLVKQYFDLGETVQVYDVFKDEKGERITIRTERSAHIWNVRNPSDKIDDEQAKKLVWLPRKMTTAKQIYSIVKTWVDVYDEKNLYKREFENELDVKTWLNDLEKYHLELVSFCMRMVYLLQIESPYSSVLYQTYDHEGALIGVKQRKDDTVPQFSIEDEFKQM